MTEKTHPQCLKCHSDMEATYAETMNGPVLDGYVCHCCGAWWPKKQDHEDWGA
jgi:transposase-like protein